MIFGEIIQDIYQGHRVPTHRSAPEIQRLSRMRIRPTLLPGFIPAVIKQTGFRISDMTLHQNKLSGNIIEVRVFMETLRIFGIERLGHVQAIQPHLIRINFLVPETTI